MIAKFDGLEPWRCEDIKGIVAPEIGRNVPGLLRNKPQVLVVQRLDSPIQCINR